LSRHHTPDVTRSACNQNSHRTRLTPADAVHT